jgi:hypothetical protein
MPISPSLDLQILFPCMGHARRGSRKRPDPPPGHVTAGSVGNGFRRLELTMRAGSNQPSAPPWPASVGPFFLGGADGKSSLIKVLYCFHQNLDDSKREAVHTTPPIRPSQSASELGLSAGGVDARREDQ